MSDSLETENERTETTNIPAYRADLARVTEIKFARRLRSLHAAVKWLLDDHERLVRLEAEYYATCMREQE